VANHLGLVADLSSVGAVRALAGAVRDVTSRLEILINNAGAMSFAREETSEGFERTFALNHLAYFALSHGLHELLAASATGADHQCRLRCAPQIEGPSL
jgi:NAD(P)-dependent dehydrogenase (short-subunit alcohol dehydrogenase family)